MLRCFLIDQWQQLRYTRSLKIKLVKLSHLSCFVELSQITPKLGTLARIDLLIWKFLLEQPQTVVNVASFGFFCGLGTFSVLNFTFLQCPKKPRLCREDIMHSLLTPHSTKQRMNALTITDKPCNFIFTKFSNMQLFPCQFPCCNAYQCPHYCIQMIIWRSTISLQNNIHFDCIDCFQYHFKNNNRANVTFFLISLHSKLQYEYSECLLCK